MVFQKKGGFKGKQQTPAKQKGKKSANASMNTFFEQESDDSESGQLMKTPGGKTPKGKQSLGDKRVSFQIPGKNTPNKTPKNDNSLVKKQPTPGKPQSALKEFKGLLQNNSGKKNKPADDDDDDEDDDDDDDDDDEDDDDIDLDMLGDDDDDDDDDDEDEEDDSEDEGGKISNKQKQMNAAQKKQNNVEKTTSEKNKSSNVQKGKDKTPQASTKESSKKALDDDDDDSSEEDDDEDIEMDMLLDDDDDSEDEESEEDEKPQQKKQKLKQNQMNISQVQGSNTPSKKEKTPAKNDKTSQAKASPKKSEKQDEKSIGHQKAMELAEERKRERDVRTLFVGNLPKDIVASELKALSADIISVNIPHIKNRKHIYAFLEFVNEAKAEENFKTLKSKKLRGQPLRIDYTGSKRQNNVPKSDTPSINVRKLYVSSLPIDATIDKIAALFPKAVSIQLNGHASYRSATVNFALEEEAAEAIEKTKNAKIDGKPITILYSVAKDRGQKRKRSKGKKHAAKKIKTEAKKESDDDDDDDDDEEEE